jgi:transposase-like protein
MKQRYRAKERERLVEAVLKTDAPIKEVAEQLGVKVATAYYWVKKARQKKRPQFAMLVPSRREKGPGLRVKVGGAVLHLERGFDAELLHDVVAALSKGSA